jgi:hypothetical protein
METKHEMQEINEEHHVQIKNTYYSCMYLIHIFYYFSKLILFSSSIFYFFGKMGCMACLVVWGI